ncbi:RNA chaperone ProQ [Agaribacter flavus]|uniref:RNA chaperone ProQ n=1 Tax=Agaribacter flavus TaxID=1902781 RepID=A0ABV7FPP9_9ALTE
MEQQKLTNTKDTLTFLSEKFPKCFIVDGDVKPLKIGIFKDLAATFEDSELVSKRLLRMSLRHYTSSWKYLAAVKKGNARINLEGEPGDLVETEHAEHAAEQLKESKKRAAEKREKEKLEKRKTKSSRFKHVKGDSNRSHSGSRDTSASKTPAVKTKNTKHIAVKIEEKDLKPGLSVSVKVGRQPMPAVITEVAKDGILVQLNSGMSVKVQQDKLRILVKD